jgi:hypothetical protein
MRDEGYYQDTQLRNGTVEDFLLSIRYLLDLDIPVLCMGRKTKAALPSSHP